MAQISDDAWIAEIEAVANENAAIAGLEAKVAVYALTLELERGKPMGRMLRTVMQMKSEALLKLRALHELRRNRR